MALICKSLAPITHQGFLDDALPPSCFVGSNVLQRGSVSCENFLPQFSLQPKSLLQMDWNAGSRQRRMSSASRILTVLSVVLLVLASGLAATSSEEEDSSSTSSPPFTDQWAVHISGGDQVADAIAARHGFTNLGKVRSESFR